MTTTFYQFYCKGIAQIQEKIYGASAHILHFENETIVLVGHGKWSKSRANISLFLLQLKLTKGTTI